MSIIIDPQRWFQCPDPHPPIHSWETFLYHRLARPVMYWIQLFRWRAGYWRTCRGAPHASGHVILAFWAKESSTLDRVVLQVLLKGLAFQGIGKYPIFSPSRSVGKYPYPIQNSHFQYPTLYPLLYAFTNLPCPLTPFNFELSAYNSPTPCAFRLMPYPFTNLPHAFTNPRCAKCSIYHWQNDYILYYLVTLKSIFNKNNGIYTPKADW